MNVCLQKQPMLHFMYLSVPVSRKNFWKTREKLGSPRQPLNLACFPCIRLARTVFAARSSRGELYSIGAIIPEIISSVTKLTRTYKFILQRLIASGDKCIARELQTLRCYANSQR